MEHLWALAVLACIWAFVATHPIRPHDFWWHLEVGREVFQTHQIPQVDAFSYTAPGAPYPSYNIYWLADLALYLVHAAGGPALSVFVHAVVITLTYGLILALCWRLSGSGRIAALCTLASAACGFENWNLRPQAIAFLFGALYLVLIYLQRSRPNASRWWLLAFPVLMVIWVNCHGSFPLGMVLLFIWLADTTRQPGRLWGRPLVALVLSGLAMLANPQGMGVLAYLRAMSNNPVVRHLPEWAPASVATKDGLAYVVVVLLSALVMALGWRKVTKLHLLSFLMFAGLAATSGRAIIWFGLVMAPVLAELLPEALSRWPQVARALFEPSPQPPDRAERTVNAVLAVALVGLVIVTLPWFKDRLPMSPQKAGLISVETPVAATKYLLEHRLPPRVFADMAYGSYLIWAGQPRYQVFTDPRVELYSQNVWREYEGISEAGADWQGLLDRYRVNTLLLDLSLQGPLVAVAGLSEQWREVYRDGHTVIFVRNAV